MEKKTFKKVRWNVINAIKSFEPYIKGKKLVFPKNDEKFNKLSEKLLGYFHLDDLKDLAVLIAALSYDNETDRGIDGYLSLSGIELLIINQITTRLFKNGYLEFPNEKNAEPKGYILRSISENITFELKPVDLISFFKGICKTRDGIDDCYELYRQLVDSGTLDTFDLFNDLYKMLNDYSLIFMVISIFLNLGNIFFNGYYLYKTIGTYNDWSERYLLKVLIDANMAPFQGLLELEKSNNTINDDTRIVFTQKAKEFFGKYNINIPLAEDKCDNTDLIKCEDIRKKNLFYKKEVKKQVDMIKDIVSEERIKTVRETLESNGLHSGITVLLYGKPGTGKTESVYQIAKETGRDILKVDMGTMKSCWFGESEQIVRRLFKSYRELCKKSKITPILLLNEADAIIGKRQDVSRSNVAQTENAIQDIMLDEIENLDGILIATTNIANNFDEAFERRFLFKVEFDNPTKDAREQIWKDKIPWLDEKGIESLANNFSFSGGQIDNILRKIIMYEVVNGKKPDIEEIMEFCKNERLDKDVCKHIGFNI